MTDEHETPVYEFGTEFDLVTGEVKRRDPWPGLVWRSRETAEDTQKPEATKE